MVGSLPLPPESFASTASTATGASAGVGEEVIPRVEVEDERRVFDLSRGSQARDARKKCAAVEAETASFHPDEGALLGP